jgi:glutaredoxin
LEEGRNVRELKRIEELLVAKAIVWKRFDISGDEATLEFVARQAHCERDDLPVVFVADRAIGGYDALVRADVSGELERLVHGA